MILPVFKREFLGYFRTPVAYVFLAVFLMAAVGLAFFVSNFFEAGVASLESYFFWHLWLFLFFDSRCGHAALVGRSGPARSSCCSRLPVTTLAGRAREVSRRLGVPHRAILLTLPMVIHRRLPRRSGLGRHLCRATSAASSWQAPTSRVCSLMSALTNNQVISFVLSALRDLSRTGLPRLECVQRGIVESALPQVLADLIANFSPTTHYDPFTKGIIDPKDIVFFVSLTACSRCSSTCSHWRGEGRDHMTTDHRTEGPRNWEAKRPRD
jgi:ABC-2 type transport system permease protein